jgi:hypothetical protein
MKTHHPMLLPALRRTFQVLAALVLAHTLASAATVYKRFTPGHYVLSAAPLFTDQQVPTYLGATTSSGEKVFRGLQRTYYWKDLETSFHTYNFQKIDDELAAMAAIDPNHKLIIQFSFKSWEPGGGNYAYPTYIHDNPAGIYGDPYGSPAGSGVGYYATTDTGNHYPFIWNVYVQNRMKEMLQALGDRYDDNLQVECINMCESATGGATSTLNLVSDGEYGDAIVTLFTAMKTSFPDTQVIQYANFPKSQQVKYAYNCLLQHVGWGGPDVVQNDVVNSPGSAPSLVGTATSPGTYAFYWDYWNYSGVHSATYLGSTYNLTIGNQVVKGAAVQNEDYTWSAGFANNYLNATTALHLNYMFWQAQWSSGNNTQVIDFVRTKVEADGPAGGLNEYIPGDTTPPGNVTITQATATSGQVAFTWTNPTNPDFEGVQICRSTTDPLVGPSSGVVYWALAPATSWVDTTVVSGQQYYYRFYAYDHQTPTNYATGVSAQVLTTYVSEGAYDGWVLESGENTNVGGSVYSAGTGTSALTIGDDGSKRQYKSILSFDTSSLPDNATIISATLKLKRGTISNNPSAFGAIYVDVQTYGINANIALENGDFAAATTVSKSATMTYPSANGTWSTGSLNPAGLNAVNKAGRTQFRVYFNLDDDNDAQADYLGFYSGDATSAADRPVLEIKYQ